MVFHPKSRDKKYWLDLLGMFLNNLSRSVRACWHVDQNAVYQYVLFQAAFWVFVSARMGIQVLQEKVGQGVVWVNSLLIWC